MKPRTVKEFIDAARAAGQDAFGLCNDQDAVCVLEELRDKRMQMDQPEDLNEKWTMLRDIVFAELIEGLNDRYIVTLECGHKKHVKEKLLRYPCHECPKET